MPIAPEPQTTIAASAQEPARGPSLLAAVRAATRAAHARVEAAPSMLRLMNDDYTEREYVWHVSGLLGFYEPLETALARVESATAAPMYANRSRLLRADLEQLGLTPARIAALPRCGDLPPVNAANALGARYVCEGASLGGQLISRQLRRSLGAARSFAFYHEDAAQTGQRWKAFCTYLESSQDVPHEAVCAAAAAVFDAFGHWLERESIGA